jgi:hypothetical protein
MTDIAQQAAQAALAGQQQQQPMQVVMPSVQFSIGETADKQHVVVNFVIGGPPFPFQEQLTVLFDPNAFLEFCKQGRTKAKELNGHVVKRQGPGGAVLLDKAPVLIDGDDDDEDDDTGDVAEPSEDDQPNEAA